MEAGPCCICSKQKFSIAAIATIEFTAPLARAMMLLRSMINHTGEAPMQQLKHLIQQIRRPQAERQTSQAEHPNFWMY